MRGKNKWNYSLVILNFINKSCKNEKSTMYTYKLPTKIETSDTTIALLSLSPPPPFPRPFSLPIYKNNRQFLPWLYHTNTLFNILVNLTFFVCVIWLTACCRRKDNYCEISHYVKWLTHAMMPWYLEESKRNSRDHMP